MRGTRAPRRTVLAGALASLAALPAASPAQMPGQPLLQNAFSNPGVTLAVNFGASDGMQGYAAAAAWSPARPRFQLSGGVGVVRWDAAPDINAAAYGARAMVPIARFGQDRSIGVAVFGGVGGASPEGQRVLYVPVGASVGYRAALGRTRSASVHVAPFFGWTQITADAAGGETRTVSKGLLRVSAAADLAVLPSIGVTLGYETGARARAGGPGPSGGTFGVGISYALRRPR